MQPNVARGTSRPWRLLACLLAALGSPGLTRADFTYTDGSFGISIQLPDNTSLTRIKNPAGQAGTEIAQFTLPEGNVVGRVVVSDLPEDWTFDRAVDLVRGQLATDTRVAPDKILADKAKVQGNVKDARLLQAWDAEHKLLNAVLVVQGPADQMLFMYVAAHDKPQEDAAAVARGLAGGFTVLLQAKDEQRLAAAMARGPEVLMNLVSPPPRQPDLWEKQYLLIYTGNEPSGCIVVREVLEERNKKPGMAMELDRWTFWPQDKAAEHEVQKAFASWDLHEDEWSSHIDTAVLAPSGDGRQVQVVSSDHHALRLGQSLMIEVTDGQTRGQRPPRVLPCPRIVIPQAWRWLVPRLLAAAPADAKASGGGEWLALVTYSPLRRGMETQMFSRASHGNVREVLQREGLYGVVENWQFAPGGQLKQISSTETRLVAAGEAEVKRLLGPRIAQWQSRLPQKKRTGA